MAMLERLRKMAGESAGAMGERLSATWNAGIARVRTAVAPTAAAARGRYEKLDRRERVLVQIAGALVALFIVFNLIYVPIQNALSGLSDRIQERQHDAVDVAHMMRTYQRLRIDLATMRARTVPASGDFSLFSVVEQALTRAPGKDKIGSITPAEKTISGGLKQYTIELKLNALSLPQVVDTLYGLSALNVPVTVSALHITRRSQDSHSFDVEMTCVALGRHG
ncbi:MAG TPA: type II secretion system protein GspM [Candidatus Binataceae bacterium]|nr:type II secretion system protein GspM [Candidatus Binataceae bacterium]HVB79710.1 type II secretion system protein GspM [Candidatus Binataceae bacterium]